jgi:hypothetical protein
VASSNGRESNEHGACTPACVAAARGDTPEFADVKLLFKTDHQPDAVAAKLLLESKGVPAFIGSERSGQLLGGIFSNTFSVWVELDHQYDDAQAILADPERPAAEPVSIDDYNAFKARWQRRFDERIGWVLRWGTFIALLAATWFIVNHFWDGIGLG